jgi:hypothetical protein
MSVAPEAVDPYDITVRSNGLRRRRIVEKVFGVISLLAAVLACAILAVVLGTLVYKGFSQLNLDFFTKPRPLFGEQGGVADALIGSAIIVGMAMLMAIPVSVLVAIYMSEYAGARSSRALKIILDVLNGVPAAFPSPARPALGAATPSKPPLPLNLPPEQKGIFWVGADGTGLRRLGPPSRERFFTSVPSVPEAIIPLSRLSFSPNGRTITFVDRGPDADGHEADQVVTVDVAPVLSSSIQLKVGADAVLYPLQQAAIIPKITAAVKRNIVPRGAPVGRLLAARKVKLGHILGDGTIEPHVAAPEKRDCRNSTATQVIGKIRVEPNPPSLGAPRRSSANGRAVTMACAENETFIRLSSILRRIRQSPGRDLQSESLISNACYCHFCLTIKCCYDYPGEYQNTGH